MRQPSHRPRVSVRRAAAVMLAGAIGAGALLHGVPDGTRLGSTVPFPPAAHAQSVPQNLPGSFADVIERVSPAVVNIEATQGSSEARGRSQMAPGDMPPGMRDFMERFFGEDFFRHFGTPPGEGEQPRGPQPRPRTGIGSGFVVDPDGYIVTNNHVIDGAETITVTFQDGEREQASLIGVDSKTDLALIKVDTDRRLASVDFGNSDGVRVGDWVLAVGSPFGLGHSVTAGIVSARGRMIGSGPYDDFLQIDAPINRGNSGGPTFNIAGDVIGVNTAIITPHGGSVGIGFAIPANMAKQVIDQLKERGFVERGWLGVTIQTVTDDIAAGVGLATTEGAIVSQLVPDGPAAAGGVRQGDVIVAVNDIRIGQMRELPRVIAGLSPGSRAELTIWRDGSEIRQPVTIGTMPDDDRVAAATPEPEPERTRDAVIGMKLAGLDAEARRQYQVPDGVSGVLVVEVDGDSPAAARGVRPGDVIIQVSNHLVSSPADVRERIEAAEADDRRAVLLLLNRRGDERFVAVPLGTA